jgi:hypothetical protein
MMTRSSHSSLYISAFAKADEIISSHALEGFSRMMLFGKIAGGE